MSYYMERDPLSFPGMGGDVRAFTTIIAICGSGVNRILHFGNEIGPDGQRVCQEDACCTLEGDLDKPNACHEAIQRFAAMQCGDTQGYQVKLLWAGLVCFGVRYSEKAFRYYFRNHLDRRFIAFEPNEESLGHLADYTKALGLKANAVKLDLVGDGISLANLFDGAEFIPQEDIAETESEEEEEEEHEDGPEDGSDLEYSPSDDEMRSEDSEGEGEMGPESSEDEMEPESSGDESESSGGEMESESSDDLPHQIWRLCGESSGESSDEEEVIERPARAPRTSYSEQWLRERSLARRARADKLFDPRPGRSRRSNRLATETPAQAACRRALSRLSQQRQKQAARALAQLQQQQHMEL